MNERERVASEPPIGPPPSYDPRAMRRFWGLNRAKRCQRNAEHDYTRARQLYDEFLVAEKAKRKTLVVEIKLARSHAKNWWDDSRVDIEAANGGAP